MALPSIPQFRIEGTLGNYISEVRSFLSALKNIKLLSGKEVSITFSASDVAGSVIKRTLTGLGYPPTGFFIFKGHNGAGLIESAPPTTETNKTVLFLRATVAGTYLIWVF